MRYPLIAAPLILATLVGATPAAEPFAGQWKMPEGNAIVTVSNCAPNSRAMCARISEVLSPQAAGGARDFRNPDPALRSRPLIGVPILSGMVKEGAQWVGQGYSPKEGRSFNAKVKVRGDKLNLEGCVSMFCRTVVWTRA